MAVARDLGEGAASWLAERGRAMEDELAALVDVNSFTENVAGGRAVAERLRGLFAVEGLVAQTHSSARYADHLTFTSSTPSNGAAPSATVLVGHFDTVFPPGTFEGYRRDGTLARGPGVLDMKGGLVVVAFALRALAMTTGLAALSPVRVAIVADEEVGSPEGAAIVRGVAEGAAAALVFEAGRVGDRIITRRKGTGAVSVKAYGKAAHAGVNPQDGANAIWALARFVDRAQGLSDHAAGVSVNVGKIQGGETKNTVPDQAEAAVDLRFLSVRDAERLLGSLRQAADDAARGVPGARLELLGGVARPPLERSEASVALMHAYAACARASGLGSEEAPLIGGGSDASTTSAMGIASIDGLGPRGKGFHTKDEQIEIASLVPKAQALARFLASRSA